MKIFRISLLIGLIFCLASSVSAQKIDCLECHKDLTEGKVVHAALQMGCDSCHTGVNASSIPHKFKGNKGLKADSPGLCYECHSKNDFTRKVRHAPVAGGLCLSCHVPHSSTNNALLLKEANLLCRQCHESIDKKPHVVFGTPPKNHELAGRKDPNREGKRFDCVSCHMPHSSAWIKLFRYEAQDTAGLCKHCHDFIQ
jgi:predicted CXXCH cytochrome family protein